MSGPRHVPASPVSPCGQASRAGAKEAWIGLPRGRRDPFERVVCGIDASGAGLDAVRQVLALARSDSELLLVGVSESFVLRGIE